MGKSASSSVDKRLAGTPRLWKASLERVRQLTLRELEVLKLTADGLSAKEIGEALGISSRTVEIHRANMVQKLQVNNTVEAILTAVYAALAEFDEETTSNPALEQMARNQERAHIIGLLECEAEHAASEGARTTHALLDAVIQFLREEM